MIWMTCSRPAAFSGFTRNRRGRSGASEEEIEQSVADVAEAMGKVAALWHNNLRFASEASLRAHLNRIGRLRGIRGDALKKNSADLLATAEIIVETGVGSWNSKRRSRRALRSHFQVEQIELVDNDGVSGFVVSPDFRDVARPDRRTRIARALRDPSTGLTRREQRRVLLIAPWTPVEFDLFGPDGDEEVDSDADSETRECFADLIPKVEQALRSQFRVDHLRLEDEDGIYGSLVSPDFEGVSDSDRQMLIDRAFRDPSSNITDCERRRIRFIMPRTPAEYEAKLDWDSWD